jgi:phospholipid-binding lipoprotein MlaA
MFDKEAGAMNFSAKKLPKLILACAAGFTLASCTSNINEQNVTDPFEDTNRAIFAFNTAVDKAVINPVIRGYRVVVPHPARQGLQNFLRNLRSPVRFANQLLQGDLNGAGNELFRTVVNTTVGVGGLFDVAGHEGYAYEPEDFGQTLAVWGVDHGPYFVAPILGPASMRDFVGYAVDSFADPLRMYTHNVDKEGWYYAKVGADYFTVRDELMDALSELEASSIDYYAAVRSAYVQNRNALAKDRKGSLAPMPEIPNFDD